MNPYSRLIPRLNGTEIEARFGYYLDLVRKGIAGFIIFGGELEAVRAGLQKLRDASIYPLIIASDLEQGLGQQLEGGTLFPPAMAIASALRKVKREHASPILKKIYAAFAVEAEYAGINTILAPVLDINTNPENPIISSRSFGEDPETVSYFGCEMVRILQQNGIMACGKHFPGHGDTEIDSHLSLPVIKNDLPSLENREFVPFRSAIEERVGMIMLGHLSVPSIDPSGRPASLSEKVVSYLRSEMAFGGLLITDAMNMGALGGYREDEASLIALKAGVDVILHPTDPDRTASYLSGQNWRPTGNLTLHLPSPLVSAPDFDAHQKLSDNLARMAVTFEEEKGFKVANPFLIILNDEMTEKGEHLIRALKDRYPEIKSRSIHSTGGIPWSEIPKDHELIVCVFSSVKACKGKAAWLHETIGTLEGRANIFLSFGNPYVIRYLRAEIKIYAYWDSEAAQIAVAEKLIQP